MSDRRSGVSVLQSSVNWALQQAHVRLGDDYDYGEVYSPTDTSLGGDCSGVAGWVLQALTQNPLTLPVDGNGRWLHVVSTESWPYDYANNQPAAPGTVGPFGTIAVASLDNIPADAALTINIEHGGGGEDSHMNVVVPLPNSLPYEGVVVESNGSYGSCTNGTGCYLSTDSLWTDHWYLPGPWTIDVNPWLPGDPIPGHQPDINPTGDNYTVQPGDTLYGIADAHGVTLEALEAANPQIHDPDTIYVGESVVIP
jgi:LysM repeat protein